MPPQICSIPGRVIVAYVSRKVAQYVRAACLRPEVADKNQMMVLTAAYPAKKVWKRDLLSKQKNEVVGRLKPVRHRLHRNPRYDHILETK